MKDSYLDWVNLTFLNIAPETYGRICVVCNLLISAQAFLKQTRTSSLTVIDSRGLPSIYRGELIFPLKTLSMREMPSKQSISYLPSLAFHFCRQCLDSPVRWYLNLQLCWFLFAIDDWTLRCRRLISSAVLHMVGESQIVRTSSSSSIPTPSQHSYRSTGSANAYRSRSKVRQIARSCIWMKMISTRLVLECWATLGPCSTYS